MKMMRVLQRAWMSREQKGLVTRRKTREPVTRSEPYIEGSSGQPWQMLYTTRKKIRRREGAKYSTQEWDVCRHLKLRTRMVKCYLLYPFATVFVSHSGDSGARKVTCVLPRHRQPSPSYACGCLDHASWGGFPCVLRQYLFEIEME
jgi:hypothetical protein